MTSKKRAAKILCAHIVFNVTAIGSKLLIFFPNGIHKNDKIRIVTTQLNCNGSEWALYGVWGLRDIFSLFSAIRMEHSQSCDKINVSYRRLSERLHSIFNLLQITSS